jgi:hypothetical protein
VPLEPDEKRDFMIKDSVHQAERDSMYTGKNVDSLRKAQKPVQPVQFIRGGLTRRFYSTAAWKQKDLEPFPQGLS